MKTVLKSNEQALMDEGKVLVRDYSKVKEITNLEPTNVANYGYVQVIDENLKSENIPVGKTILGVPGSYEIPDSSESVFNDKLTSITNNATKIGNGTFKHCKSLTSVSFPQCSYIGNSAFAYCSSLTTADFPNCTYIGSYAFNYCSSLTSVNFPMCTNIGSSAFYGCKVIDLPMISSIYESQFSKNSVLTSVKFDTCKYIGNSAFYSCSNLITAEFPQCTYIGDHAFESCKSLTSVSFPQCSYIGNGAFAYCSSLTTISLPMCKELDGAFYMCGIKSIYLNVSSVPIITLTEFAYCNGFSIYVPASLYEAFTQATNWSTHSARIVSYF